jgi:hypothetical protein
MTQNQLMENTIIIFVAAFVLFAVEGLIVTKPKAGRSKTVPTVY